MKASPLLAALGPCFPQDCMAQNSRPHHRFAHPPLVMIVGFGEYFAGPRFYFGSRVPKEDSACEQYRDRCEDRRRAGGGRHGVSQRGHRLRQAPMENGPRPAMMSEAARFPATRPCFGRHVRLLRRDRNSSCCMRKIATGNCCKSRHGRPIGPI